MKEQGAKVEGEDPRADPRAARPPPRPGRLSWSAWLPLPRPGKRCSRSRSKKRLSSQGPRVPTNSAVDQARSLLTLPVEKPRGCPSGQHVAERVLAGVAAQSLLRRRGLRAVREPAAVIKRVRQQSLPPLSPVLDIGDGASRTQARWCGEGWGGCGPRGLRVGAGTGKVEVEPEESLTVRTTGDSPELVGAALAPPPRSQRGAGESPLALLAAPKTAPSPPPRLRLKRSLRGPGSPSRPARPLRTKDPAASGRAPGPLSAQPKCALAASLRSALIAGPQHGLRSAAGFARLAAERKPCKRGGSRGAELSVWQPWRRAVPGPRAPPWSAHGGLLLRVLAGPRGRGSRRGLFEDPGPLSGGSAPPPGGPAS